MKAGDSVSIVAVVSKGTATAKTLIDTTTLKANGASWAPMPTGAADGYEGSPVERFLDELGHSRAVPRRLGHSRAVPRRTRTQAVAARAT